MVDLSSVVLFVWFVCFFSKLHGQYLCIIIGPYPGLCISLEYFAHRKQKLK